MLPLVWRLGFYSDDWWFLSVLARADGSSLDALYRAIAPEVSARPVQAAYLAVLYRMFGRSAPGYHAVNAIVFAAALIAVMLVLRRVGVPRRLAVAIPALFAVMPHYSTDRLWVAVFQANLSLALFAFATLLDLRAVESARRFIAWKLAGALALAGALMAYEIVGPLTLLACALLIRHALRAPREVPDRRIALALVACAIDLAVMTATAVWKSGVSDRLGVSGPTSFCSMTSARTSDRHPVRDLVGRDRHAAARARRRPWKAT
jgi:hypothetical protein